MVDLIEGQIGNRVLPRGMNGMHSAGQRVESIHGNSRGKLSAEP